MTLEEALQEIERLKTVIREKDNIIEKLKKKKNAGRPPQNAKWQASYDYFVSLYEDGLTMAEIVERSECSRRTCYRYKTYYEAMKEKKE